MAVELKFSKFDNTPWGFRLIGGSDFDTPLTVIKVADHSLSEQAGMRVGDTIVRINDLPAAPLTHAQAHEVISKAGNNFVLAVIRGTIDDNPENQNKVDPASICFGYPPGDKPKLLIAPEGPPEVHMAPSREDEEIANINGGRDGGAKTPSNLEVEGLKIKTARSRSPMRALYSVTIENQVSDNEQSSENFYKAEYVRLAGKPDPNLTEEQIAEMMSGEAEALSVGNQAVLGVNFKKLVPNVEFIKKSEVFQVLNTEATKTAEEKQMENEKWTTFLQRPKNAAPQDKKREQQNKAKGPAYKVNLKHEKRPANEEEQQKSEENTENDSTGKNDENQNENSEGNQESQEDPPAEPQSDVSLEGVHIDDSLFLDFSALKEGEQETQNPEVEPEPEEGSMEDQLAQVQKQLLALSQLPAAIQATLEAVTQQLSKIVKTEQLSEGQAEEQEDANQENGEEFYDGEPNPDSEELLNDENQNPEDGGNEEAPIEAPVEEPPPPPEPEPEPEENLTPEEREKRDKEAKVHQQNLEAVQSLEDQEGKRRVRTPKIPPMTFEHERPIILPGGRKWRNPEDACPNSEEYVMKKILTDDEIAVTISSQSEILVGTTLGISNCGLVPSKAIEQHKINFLKYQANSKPKTLDHLQNSEVLKLVNTLDAPVKGIPGRPSMVCAEQDFYKNTALASEETVPPQMQP